VRNTHSLSAKRALTSSPRGPTRIVPIAVQIQHALLDEVRQNLCTHVVRNPE
jgi:hypothetical protein